MGLPGQEFDTPLRPGPELELIQGEAVFTGDSELRKLRQWDQAIRIRDTSIMDALNQYNPREVLSEVMRKLQLTTASDRSIVAEQVIDRAVDLKKIGDEHIDGVFDPDRRLKRSLEPEDYEEAQKEFLYSLVDGMDDEDRITLENAAAVIWHSDEIIDEAGYGNTDLVRALKKVHNEADAMYSEVTKEAFRLGKIGIIIEQNLLEEDDIE